MDLAVVAIQAALDLSKRVLTLSDFSSHAIAFKILEQAHNAVLFCRTNPEDKAEWLALLSASFYNRGVTLYLGELHVPALPFIQRSVDIAQNLQLQDGAAEQKPSTETVAVLAELAIQYPKRLELLAACHIRKGDKMASLRDWKQAGQLTDTRISEWTSYILRLSDGPSTYDTRTARTDGGETAGSGGCQSFPRDLHPAESTGLFLAERSASLS